MLICSIRGCGHSIMDTIEMRSIWDADLFSSGRRISRIGLVYLLGPVGFLVSQLIP